YAQELPRLTQQVCLDAFWAELDRRFDQKRTVLLSRAREDFNLLEIRKFASITEHDAKLQDDTLRDLLAWAEAARYVDERRGQPKCHSYLAIFDTISDVDFRQHVHMSRQYFARLCELLKTNAMFSNNSTYEQSPVPLPVACILERLGKYGTGASSSPLKLLHGRVIKVLIDMVPDMICWPDAHIGVRYRVPVRHAVPVRNIQYCGSGTGVGLGDILWWGPLRETPSSHGEP
ncbi:MAG: hypothetical protein BJ554DRAFT_7819, partial [Olpidium bornovanus]